MLVHLHEQELKASRHGEPSNRGGLSDVETLHMTHQAHPSVYTQVAESPVKVLAVSVVEQQPARSRGREQDVQTKQQNLLSFAPPFN